MSREYTKEEVREKFLKHLKVMAKYWAGVERDTVEEQIEGALFSALVLIDGGVVGLPAFDLVCAPHPSDKAFHQEEGDDWFPEEMIINDDTELHHEFAQMRDK